jgi:glycosyltransferase involved in cell wall biosynthesis
MKLSIIIPSYNVEKHIESCLRSCYQQDLSLSDYEVIIVNDGSTDHTEQKVNPFTKIYSNLRLESQANKGHGAARNVGVSLSKGDYLYFLDADDYIARNTLGTLIKILEAHNLDMLVFKSKTVLDNSFINSVDYNSYFETDAILNGIDFLGTNSYSPEVWRYIIKASFYTKSKLFFYDRKFVQDAFFTPTLMSRASRILSIRFDVHRYRLSKNSITRNTSYDHLKIHLDDLCFAVEKLSELRQDLMLKGITNRKALEQIQIKQQHYVFIIITRFMRSNMKTSKLKDILSNFKSMDAYPLNSYQSSLNHRKPLNVLLTTIFNRSFLLYPSLYSYRVYNHFRYKLR